MKACIDGSLFMCHSNATADKKCLEKVCFVRITKIYT